MKNFMCRQIDQIRKDPLCKIAQKMIYLVACILVLPLILIIRLLRPFVLIRFGVLPSSRIGPFATCPELYLCERDQGLHRSCLDFFCCHKEKLANGYLKKMWSRLLSISGFAGLLSSSNKFVPGSGAHMVPIPDEKDFRGLLACSRPHLKFTQEEEDRANALLQEQGISLDGKFICFAARDSAYLRVTHPEKDWSKHDYRDANILDYIPAVEELVRRGFTAFRMGAIVHKPLDHCPKGVVDYATTFRTDFMDMFLLGHCSFFFGAHSGINSIPMIFRRPKAVTDVIYLHSVHTWMPEDLFIPKKLWLLKEKRFMTFSEIIESGTWRFGKIYQYQERGLKIVNNTPEEIAALAIEMDERHRGAWKTTEKDEILQERFWEIFNKPKRHGKPVSRIGTEFLRENQELLAEDGRRPAVFLSY